TLAGAAEAWRDRDRRRTYGFAAVVMTALLLPRALGYEPRMDLVEYNLGRLDDEQGQPAAQEHYKAAFVLNPKDFLACLNLGNLAARQRDWATALRFYQRAAALEPRSDDAESNQGGV